jgi:hypothetical protein
MSAAPPDPDDFVARARQAGSLDLGGLRLDIDPAADTLLVSCSGFVPAGHVIYAHEHTAIDHKLHRLFTCDSSHHWYLAGVPGLTESIYATVGLLGALIAEVRPARSIAVGTSMGGYLSLLLGCAGLVDEAIAFSPQTTLDPEWRRANGDHRWGADIDAGLAALAPLPPPDVAAWAAAPGQRGTRLHVFYPTAEPPDVAHALRLRGAGALMYPVDTCHHVVPVLLRKRGVLHLVIREILAGGTPLALVEDLHDDPDDPERAYREGAALLRQAAHREAERAFRVAVAAAVPVPHYFVELAEAIWCQGRHDEALLIGQDAVARLPHDADRRIAMSVMVQRLGSLGAAEDKLWPLRKLIPGDRTTTG